MSPPRDHFSIEVPGKVSISFSYFSHFPTSPPRGHAQKRFQFFDLRSKKSFDQRFILFIFFHESAERSCTETVSNFSHRVPGKVSIKPHVLSDSVLVVSAKTINVIEGLPHTTFSQGIRACSQFFLNFPEKLDFSRKK